MNNRKNRILELAWLLVAILSLGVFITDTLKNGFNNSYRFVIIFIFALFVYFLRRKNRTDSGKKQPDP